jgi:hypothetical protein
MTSASLAMLSRAIETTWKPLASDFSGVPGDQLLERMIELSLYTEDKL